MNKPLDKPLNIALLTYSTQPRGSVIHTVELAEALTSLEHFVTIFALDKNGKGFERSLASSVQPVPTHPAPSHIDQLIQQRIQEFVDFLSNHSLHYDIYHAQDCIGANALLLLRQQGIISHFIRTVHHVEDYQSSYLRNCQDKSIREPDLCFCVSDRWRSTLQSDYHIDALRVFNGVDSSRFSSQSSGREAALKDKYGIKGKPVYLTIGGIEPRKNSIRLLQAFAQVVRIYPSAQLIVAGGATVFDYQDYRQQFFTTLETLNVYLEADVILTGILSETELLDIYRCADVFVFPSLQEGWGLVLLEAIASGLPIVTSNISPFTEFLSPEIATFVNPTSVSEIAQGMLTAIADSSTTSQNKQLELEQARQELLSHHSWSRSAQIHVQHYQHLLEASLTNDRK